MAEQEKIAWTVHYTGQVQGVGFRYTASTIARAHQVTGWVRNLPDGRVQLVVEGPEKDVDRCLQAIRDYWGAKISDELMEEVKPSGFAAFEIRR